MKPLAGKIALITGASRGIGYAVSKRLAAEGAHVIAVARTTGGLERLDDDIFATCGKHATLVPIDITEGDTIDVMATNIYARFKKIDIIVGCAGVLGPLSPTAHIPLKDFDTVIQTNMVANWRLLRTFDSLLRQSDAGRVIFVTSNVSCEGRAFWGAYGASKAGLESLVKSYAQEVKNISPIKANLVNPHKIATKMRAEAYPGEDPSTLTPPKAITDIFVKLAGEECTDTGKIFKTP